MALKSVYSLLVIHCEMCQEIDDDNIGMERRRRRKEKKNRDEMRRPSTSVREQ